MTILQFPAKTVTMEAIYKGKMMRVAMKPDQSVWFAIPDLPPLFGLTKLKCDVLLENAEDMDTEDLDWSGVVLEACTLSAMEEIADFLKFDDLKRWLHNHIIPELKRGGLVRHEFESDQKQSPNMQDLLSNMFEGHEIRTAIKNDGTIWFVLTDVCSVLGIENNRNVAARLRENQRGVHTMDTLGGSQEMTLVSETGLYSVILKSRSPKAEPFQIWVEDVVLPSIRKTGRYGSSEPTFDPRDPKQVVKVALQLIEVNQEQAVELAETKAQLIATEVRAQDAEKELEEVVPKAEALDRLSNAEGLVNCTTAAKCIGVRPKFFFKWLSQNGWTYRRAGSKNWLAYQDKIQSGYLDHKLTTQEVNGEERIFQQVMVTAKGITKLTELIGNPAA